MRTDAAWMIAMSIALVGCAGGSEAGKGRVMALSREAPLPLGMEEEASDRGSGSSNSLMR